MSRLGHLATLIFIFLKKFSFSPQCSTHEHQHQLPNSSLSGLTNKQHTRQNNVLLAPIQIILSPFHQQQNKRSARGAFLKAQLLREGYFVTGQSPSWRFKQSEGSQEWQDCVSSSGIYKILLTNDLLLLTTLQQARDKIAEKTQTLDQQI